MRRLIVLSPVVKASRKRSQCWSPWHGSRLSAAALAGFAAVSLLASLGSPAFVAAGSYWWDTTTPGTWATPANWWITAGGTVTGGPPGASDDAIFNGTGANGATTVQLNAATSVLGMTFANSGSTLLESAGPAGYALTTGTDGITANSGAGDVTLGDPSNSMPVVLGGNQTWTNNSSSPMTVVNNVSDGAYSLTVSGSGNTLFSGGINNGSGGLTMNGPGVMTLTALNTYSGATTVNGGTLQLGTGVSGQDGSIADSSGVTNNGAMIYNLCGSQSTSYAITGSGSLTKSGSGLLRLNASGNTSALDTLLQFTGGVNVAAGTLQIVDANALFNNNSGTAAVSISTSPGSVLELDSTINYFPTTGSYQSSSVSNWALGTAGGVTIGGNGVLRFNGAGSGVFGLNDQGYAAVIMAMTGGTLDISGGTLVNGGWQGTNWANNKSSMNIAAGATFLMYNGNSPTVDALSGGGTIDSGAWGQQETLTVGINNGSGTFSGVFANTNTGTFNYGAVYGLTKTGSGVQVLSGANTYWGATTVSEGTLKLDFSAPGAPLNNIINNVTNRSSLVLGSGTLTIQGKAGAVNSQQFNGLTIGPGALELTAIAGIGGTLNVALGRNTTYADPGSTIDLTLPTSGSVSASGLGWPDATVNGGSAWASTTAMGQVVALTSYSSTNSFPNYAYGTTLITSSTTNNGGYTGVITFNHPNTTLTLTGAGGQTIYSGGILVTPQATGTVIAGGPIHGAPGGYAGTYDLTVIDYGSLNMEASLGYSTVEGQLAVSGPGLTTLSGTNVFPFTYFNGPGTTILAGVSGGTGTTEIRGGKLYLTGSSANTTIIVDGGAWLGGSGSAPAATVYVANGGILDFSQSNSSNALAVSAVRVADGGILDFRQSNSSSPLAVSTLTFAGGGTINVNDAANQYATTPAMSVTTLTTTSSPINLYVSNVPLSIGTMQILKYSGAIGGSGFGAFQLAFPVNSASCSYSLVNSSDCIELNYWVPYLYWAGAGDMNWNTSSTNNWSASSGNAAATFQAGDTVVFDNRASSSTPIVTINAGNVSPGSVFFSNSGATTYTLQGSYGIIGSASLTVNGGGAVIIISNSNGYTGGTTVSGGTLQVGNAAALGSGALTVNSGVVDLQGYNLMVGPLGGSGGTILTNSSGSMATLNLNMPSGATTYSGVLANGLGTLGLTVNGAGMLTLLGSNTYTGSTTINGGTLMIGSGGATGSPSAGSVITDNGVLGFNLSTSAAQGAQFTSNPISGTGGLLQMGSGMLTLTANNTYSGNTVIATGTLAIGNGGNSGTPGTGSIFNDGILVFNRSDSSLIVANNISGSGSVNQNGNGSIIIFGSNTYTGGTSITAGTLTVGVAPGAGYSALGNNSAVTLANSASVALNLNGYSTPIGSLSGGGPLGGDVFLGSGSLTVGGDNTSPAMYAGVISGGGGLTKVGSGTMTLGGSNTYTGSTIVSGGTLKLAPTGVAIGIQFTGEGGPIGSTYNGVFNMTNWNSFAGAGSNAPSVLKDSHGNSTTAILDSFGGVNSNMNWTGSSVPLLNGFLDAPDTLTVSNIPYARYDVIAYFGSYVPNLANRVQLSTAGSTYYFETEGTTNAYVPCTSTTPGVYSRGNYAIWSNTSGGSLTVDQPQGSITALGLNGIQIIDDSPNNILPAATRLTIAGGATVDLNGASQQVASLGDYGAGSGSIINSASTTAILTLSPSGGSTTFSGMIRGGSSYGDICLMMSGAGTQVLAGSLLGPGNLAVNSGTLILSGTDGYTGGTTVDSGTLIVTNSDAFPSGTGLTVGAGGTFILDPAQAASAVMNSGAAAAVPEPSTLALLGVGVIGLLGCAWRRRFTEARG